MANADEERTFSNHSVAFHYGDSERHGHQAGLTESWLREQLASVTEATLVTAYWDGKFLKDMIESGLGKLQSLCILVHDRDYFAKQTVYRDDAVPAEAVRSAGQKAGISIEIRLVECSSGIFHAKLFVFGALQGNPSIWIGSANATKYAFTQNVEILVRTGDSARQDILSWLINCRDAARPPDRVLGSSLSDLLMTGYFWAEAPKTNRSIGVSLTTIDGWEPPEKRGNVPDSLELGDSASMTIPRVLNLCEKTSPTSPAGQVAKALRDVGFVERSGSGSLQLPRYTVWTAFGRWASPKCHGKLEEKNLNTTANVEAWSTVTKNLRKAFESEEYREQIKIQIEAIREYSHDKLDIDQLKNQFIRSQDKFESICSSPQRRQRLSRTLESKRVPNLHALRESDPDFADWIVDSWVRSLLDYGQAARDVIKAFDLSEEWKELTGRYNDAQKIDEIVKEARRLIEDAWSKCGGVLPPGMRAQNDQDMLATVYQCLGIHGEIDSEVWPDKFNQILNDVHADRPSQATRIDQWAPLDWASGLRLLTSYGQRVPGGQWMAMPWRIVDDDDHLVQWLGAKGNKIDPETGWRNWVWCSGIPIFDPPHYFGERDEPPGHGVGYGWRLSPEEAECWLPLFESDPVGYAVLGGQDLRKAIRDSLIQYANSDKFKKDADLVGRWIKSSTLEHVSKDFQKFQEVKGEVARLNDYGDAKQAYWRRRITACGGALVVAPMGEPYFNLWGEPCCCGRVLKYLAKNSRISFRKCRLCNKTPSDGDGED